MDFPQLLIRGRTASYDIDVTWLAWDDRRLRGIALTGPEVTVTGASAWLLTHTDNSTATEIRNLPEDHPAYDPEVPLRLTIDEGPWLRRTASVTWAPRQRWHQAILIPREILTPPAGSEEQPERLVLHWGNPAAWRDTVWQHLQAWSVPLDSSWQPAFFEYLGRSGLRVDVLSHWAMPGTPSPMMIRMTGLDKLGDYVRLGLQLGWFRVPDGFGPNPGSPLGPDATPDDYLRAWAPALGQQLDQLVVPRIRAGTEAPAAWSTLGRQPFPAQGDVIQALSATLDQVPSGLLIGEQGTGKTLMMGTIPWDLFVRRQGRHGYRVLVVAPDHLIDKWQREVIATIPHATATVIPSWREALTLPARWAKKPTHPEYWIIGRDRAKYSYGRKFGAYWNARRGYWACPDCGQILQNPETGVYWDRDMKTANRSNRHCPFCKTPLWTADNTLRRVSPMAYLAHYAPKRCDCVIFDEVHELKGATEQGQVLALGQRVGKTLLAGTGTLGSGFADDLHLIQYRLNPQSMVAEGIAHDDLLTTQRRYGRIETTTRFDGVSEEDEEKKYGRTAKTRRTQKRLPGLSPLWFATKLVDRAAFIRLDDLGHDALPVYTEEVQWMTMEDDQAAWHDDAIGRIRRLAEDALRQGSSRLLGKLLAMSLTLADEPWMPQHVLTHPDGVAELWTPPETLTDTRRYPKEQQILADVLRERAAGRKVWIFTTYTQTHPQSARLADILRSSGLRVAVLTGDVTRTKREVWIDRQLQQGVEVIVSHPGLVETGLDLFAFPSIFWFSTGYNLFRLRQASRRAWRIGQTAPCLVRFYAYENTMEDTALKWMAQKLEMAQALEGDLNLEGLQRITEQSGGGNELARALVHGLHGVTDVSAVWRRAQQIPLPSATTGPRTIAFPTPARSAEPIALTTRQATSHRKKPSDESQLAWRF